MIFGKNGDKVVQKMQEWAQIKLDTAFDPDDSVKFLLNHKIPISSVAIAENDEYNLKWKIIEKVYLND